MIISENVTTKFWNSIKQTKSCWDWIGTIKNNKITLIVEGKEYSPRKISLLLAGTPPLDTMRAHSTCGNKCCVNPQHLVVGDEPRFWSKVYKFSESNGGCWVWTAASTARMYGYFRCKIGGKRALIRAHIYSWQLFTGKPVPKGLCVCHKCDHPYCVNPDHLFLGTHDDNVQDKISKGRQSHKLDTKQVIEIRQLHQAGFSISTLATIYHVDRRNIYSIIDRETWKHV